LIGRRRRQLYRGVTIGLALLLCAGLAGCGSHTAMGNRVRGRELTVYVSMPLHGVSAASGHAVLDGARLALAASGDRVGRFRVALKGLDDSTPAREQWDPGQTTLNARLASLDPTTIGYIGELQSGATAVSIPLLNRAGIAQVSPWSTAAGLTVSDDGASPGEPAKYYPTGVRTFVRVVPNDGVQAATLVTLEQRLGCAGTDVLDDGEVDSQDLTSSFTSAARAANLRILGAQSFQPHATDYSSLVAGVAQTRAPCVLISATADSAPARLVEQVGAALPRARIFATSGLGQSTFADPARGGIPIRLGRRVLLTVAALGPRAYPPSGRQVLARYAARYGDPEPAAIYGYEAMSLLLSAVSRATADGSDPPRRSQVTAALFQTRDRHSVLGTYSIDRSGDTTIARYGVWRIAHGRLRYLEAITP
jgi:branched-chain amino acid transport system substrate-binding protein